MNLANLPHLAKKVYFLHQVPKCFRFKTFQNDIKFLNLNFDIFKGFLILIEFGKLGKFANPA